MVEGDVAESRDEHRQEVQKSQISERGGGEHHAVAICSCGIGGLPEKRVANRLPMRSGGIRIARRPQHRRRQEEQHNHDRARKNHHGENQQLFVPTDD